MKKFLSIILPVVLLFGASSSFAAASKEDLKVGVVDIRAIISQSADVKAINKRLHSKFKPRQERILAMEKKLQKQIGSLKRNESVMSTNEKRKAQEKIIQGKRDIQRLEEDYQQDLSLQQNKEMETFFVRLKKEVNQIAKNKGYDIILQKGSVPYASSRVDITKLVLKKLS